MNVMKILFYLDFFFNFVKENIIKIMIIIKIIVGFLLERYVIWIVKDVCLE